MNTEEAKRRGSKINWSVVILAIGLIVFVRILIGIGSLMKWVAAIAIVCLAGRYVAKSFRWFSEKIKGQGT
jgi:hypothetical protein